MCSSFVVFADDEAASDPNAQAAPKAAADAAGASEGSDSGDGSSASTGGSGDGSSAPTGGESNSGSAPNGEGSSDDASSSTGSDSGDGVSPSNSDSSLDPTLTEDPDDPKASMIRLSLAPAGSGDDPADEKRDDPATSTKKVTLFNYANWDGPSGDYSVDENGNVVIDNFLISHFEPGAYGSESIVMMLGNTIYSFTIYSDGFIFGELPEGFTISGRNLMISGINGDLEIAILEQTALSSTFEEPSFEEPVFDDPSKTEDPAPARHKINGTFGSKTTAIPFVASVDAMSIEPSVVDPAPSAPKNSDQAGITNTRGIGENSSPSPFKGFHPVQIIILMLTVGGMIIVPKFVL